LPPSITTVEYELLRKYIREVSGISLDDTKVSLVSNRLLPLLEKFSCDSYMSLYKQAMYNKEIRRNIFDAITTNETSFFRDPSVYEMIRDNFIPFYLNKSNSLQIWSAAASYGQEPYSLSMILHETINDINKFKIKIEATDISNDAIAYASYGLYSKLEVSRGVNEMRLFKHFDLVEKGFRVKDHLRYIVHYRELNLTEPLPFENQFDIILCRNVAIYFDLPTKKKLFEALAKCLKPNGRLVIGSTESLWRITDVFYRQDYNGTIYYTLTKDPLG